LKKIFFISFLILWNNILFAQKSADSINLKTNNFEIGPEGGVGYISLIDRQIYEIKPVKEVSVGAISGVFVQYNFPKIISLRTGFAYEKKGSFPRFILKDSIGQIVTKASMRMNLYYLTVPFLIRATFGKKPQIFVNVGPYFSLLLKHSYELQNVYSYSEDFFLFGPFDYGLSSGIGISFPLLKQISINLEVRNNLGFQNILYENEFQKFKNISFDFIIGLAYKIGKRKEDSK